MIMGLFSFVRRAKAGSSQGAMRAVELGRGLVAMRVAGEFRAPPGCVELVFSAAGQARRVPSSRAGADEKAYCFHPGPYTVEFAPYEGAPELGLQLRFVIDAADPRVAQQRFDLYLFSEVEDALPVAGAGGAIEGAVREALAQGTLDLPACTTLQEWNAFRAGLNQLLYTRFGVTVDDCIPIDLGERVDYAAMLRARAAMPESVPAVPSASAAAAAEATAVDPREDAASAPSQQPATAAQAGAVSGARRPAAVDAPPMAHGSKTPEPKDTASADARALRRLFLELPYLSSGLRLLPLPPGQPLFVAHRNLLQRIAVIALDVNTMPSLAWAAPGQPLAKDQQSRRAQHSRLAVQVLDQAWALLARMQLAAAMQCCEGEMGALLDDADRLVSNLDFHLAQRRVARATAAESRREPTL